MRTWSSIGGDTVYANYVHARLHRVDKIWSWFPASLCVSETDAEKRPLSLKEAISGPQNGYLTSKPVTMRATWTQPSTDQALIG